MSKKIINHLVNFIRIVYELFRFSIILIALTLIILYICGIRPYIVKSGSMEPTIMTGSVCFVNHNSRYESVKSGDIITFKLSDDSVVTHRATSTGADGIRTKGDANELEDALPVTEDTFVGKTIFHISKVGYLVARLRTRMGIIMTISIMIFLLLLGKLLEKPKDEQPKDEQPQNEPPKET